MVTFRKTEICFLVLVKSNVTFFTFHLMDKHCLILNNTSCLTNEMLSK